MPTLLVEASSYGFISAAVTCEDTAAIRNEACHFYITIYYFHLAEDFVQSDFKVHSKQIGGRAV